MTESFEVTNPLILKRADPWMYHHTDGYYYFIATEPEYKFIGLRRADSVQGLATVKETAIWTAHGNRMSQHIWAPELHYIDGTWYIYFAAASLANQWDIRLYVLENTSSNPIEGSWTEKGEVVTPMAASDGTKFTLDATTFEHNGIRYLLWADRSPNLDQNTQVYIDRLVNPWTIEGNPVMLTKPEYEWEINRYAVNEGPAVIKRNGRIFISYSASATDSRYAVGLLFASEDANLLDARSWTKSSEPVMQTSVQNSIYGPGHSMFSTSPKGTIDLLVYHARNYDFIEERDGNALANHDRHARVQKLNWSADGMPILGPPLPEGTITITTD
ncbi:MAG: family 43 glycosylhydrolase [Deltaproteobacteria bacterium]|nr:family 43 glycosylhydrolase [Deltaproteobacteria bacterium]